MFNRKGLLIVVLTLWSLKASQCQVVNRKSKWSITTESQIKSTRSVVINQSKYFIQDPDQFLWVLI